MAKHILITTALLLGLVLGDLGLGGLATASAQPGPHRGHHGPALLDEGAVERRVARLTERLALDEHQVTRVRAILEEARTEALALRDGSGPGPERRARFVALMEATRERIDAELNEAQRSEFAAMRAELRARREARRARHRGGEGRGLGHRGRARHGRGEPDGI
jgi:hypothetical protein